MQAAQAQARQIRTSRVSWQSVSAYAPAPVRGAG
jgi:hypothetical protein